MSTNDFGNASCPNPNLLSTLFLINFITTTLSSKSLFLRTQSKPKSVDTQSLGELTTLSIYA